MNIPCRWENIKCVYVVKKTQLWCQYLSNKVNDRFVGGCAWIGCCGHFEELWYSLENRVEMERRVWTFYLLLESQMIQWCSAVSPILMFLVFFQNNLSLFSACLVFHSGIFLLLCCPFCLVLGSCRARRAELSLLEVVGRNSPQETCLRFPGFTLVFSAAHEQPLLAAGGCWLDLAPSGISLMWSWP